MSALPKHHWTEEEYLAFEWSSELRHEYLNGRVRELPATGSDHNLMETNILGILHPQLRERDYSIFLVQMRVKVEATGLYTYPDLVVVAGKTNFADDQYYNLLNPTIAIEVITPETESYERGEKFQHYRTIPSLQAYVLVSSHKPSAEYYERQPDNRWLVTYVSALDSVLNLDVIGCELPLYEVYRQITFDYEER
jgi:Uma2 family endonuclease